MPSVLPLQWTAVPILAVLSTLQLTACSNDTSPPLQTRTVEAEASATKRSPVRILGILPHFTLTDQD